MPRRAASRPIPQQVVEHAFLLLALLGLRRRGLALALGGLRAVLARQHGRRQLQRGRESMYTATVADKALFIGGVVGCNSCPIGNVGLIVDIYDASAG